MVILSPAVSIPKEPATAAEAKRVANQIASVCGIRRTLVVASGVAVFDELRRLGVNVFALNTGDWPATADVITSIWSSLAACQDGQFDCVALVDSLELTAAANPGRWVTELRRISTRYVYVAAGVSPRGTGGKRGRAYWEEALLSSGFRRHPAYFRINDYASVNNEDVQLGIAVERIPSAAAIKPTLHADAVNGRVCVDSLRVTGAEADAHVVRFQWAAEYVRPGDRVLDVGCGLGSGSYVLKYLSEAHSVCGLDDRRDAIAYAEASFGKVNAGLSFVASSIQNFLEGHAEGSFDLVVAFDILASGADAGERLAQFGRLLSPGGRLVVRMDAGTVGDNAGSRSNAGGWAAFENKLKAPMLLEQIFVQTLPTNEFAPADGMGRIGRSSLCQIEVGKAADVDQGCLLVVAMKNPLHGFVPYRESVYGYSQPPGHLTAFARDYRNPWLVRALVEFPFRARSAQLLGFLADQVLADPQNAGWPDEAAALALLGYQRLSAGAEAETDVALLLARIDGYLALPITSPHGLRWNISLSYLRAQFHQRSGELQQALDIFHAVANMDCSAFSPTIGTKLVDAAYEGGMILASLDDMAGARRMWKTGVQKAFDSFRAPVEEFVGALEFPLTFPGAVMVELLDSAVRSIRALRWTSDECAGDPDRLFEISRQNWKWMIRERTEALAASESMVRDRGAAIDDMERMIKTRDESLAAQAALVQARDEAITGQAELIRTRDEAMAAQAQLIRSRDEAIAAQAQLIRSRDEAITAQALLIDERNVSLSQQAVLLNDRAAAMESMEAMIVDRDGAIVANTAMIQARDVNISRITALLSDRDQVIQSLGVAATERDIALANEQEKLARMTRYAGDLASLHASLPVRLLKMIGIVRAVEAPAD